MFIWFYIFVCASAGRFVTEQMMVGQPQEVPVNSTKVLNAAQFAVVEFNRANAKYKFAYNTVSITSAKMQITLF